MRLKPDADILHEWLDYYSGSKDIKSITSYMGKTYDFQIYRASV